MNHWHEDDLEPSADERQLARLVDGELDAAAADALRTRLLAEPTLRARHDELVELRACFEAGRAEAGPTASAGFAANVLREARRLPTSETMPAGAPLEGEFAVVARRILIAAVLLFGIGLLVWGGLLRGGDPGRLEASPAEVEKAIQDLDRQIVERGGR